MDFQGFFAAIVFAVAAGGAAPDPDKEATADLREPVVIAAGPGRICTETAKDGSASIDCRQETMAELIERLVPLVSETITPVPLPPRQCLFGGYFREPTAPSCNVFRSAANQLFYAQCC